MGRNVEIKARIAGRWDETVRLAQQIAHSGPSLLTQEDIFYNVPRGRLKLRTQNGRSEMIYYLRADQNGPKESNYVVLPVAEPPNTKKILAEMHGQRAVVRKQRTLFLVGQTRIHLDRVEGLGDFLELEVVMRDEQTSAEGEEIARDIMEKLGVTHAHLIERAYVDLLSQND
jgi:predicted adenylyl cyclase CyaB